MDFVCSLSVHEPAAKTKRLDGFLTECFPQFSRALIQRWIKNGEVKLIKADKADRADKADKAEVVKPSFALRGKEQIEISGKFPEQVVDLPQAIELNIAYEDDDLMVIDKPAGLVVHPGAGNPDQTLLNALLAYNQEQQKIPRAGLVHRLDRGTSGLMIVAKNLTSYNQLNSQLQERLIKRSYLAIVEGVPVSGGRIELAIARDPQNRVRRLSYPPEQAPAGAKEAVSNFRVKKKFARHSLLEVSLETGRTHQIRSHLKFIGYPIVGDSLYGWQRKLPPQPEPGGVGAGGDSSAFDYEAAREFIRGFARPALHSASLSFSYQAEDSSADKNISLTAEPPADFTKLLDILRGGG